MASPGRDSSPRLKTWGRVSEEHGEQEERESPDGARRTLETLLLPFRRQAERTGGTGGGWAGDRPCCYGIHAAHACNAIPASRGLHTYIDAEAVE